MHAEREALRQHQHDRFQYVKIIQSPSKQASLDEIMDQDTLYSLNDMLTLRKQISSPSFVVDIRRGDTELINPFMLFDERFLRCLFTGSEATSCT